MLNEHSQYAAFQRLAARYHAGDFTPAEYAARYVLQWQLIRHGSRLAQRRSRSDVKPDGAAWLVELDRLPPGQSTTRVTELLERYDLRGVSRRVNLALIGWLRGDWPLTLCESVPSVRDVLRMQTRGTRAVTLIADYPALVQPVLEKPDGHAFICHDLEHAWQFFHDAERHASQCRFAQRLDRAIEQGVFASYVADPVFAEKFDYLAADMNTHVVHSLHYLRAILLDFYLRAEGKGPSEQLSPTARGKLYHCLEVFKDEPMFSAVGFDSWHLWPRNGIANF